MKHELNRLKARLVLGAALLAVLLILVPLSLAWYVSLKTANVDKISGVVQYGAQYFESGTGTIPTQLDAPEYSGDFSTPAAYQIKTPLQFYNLAWLQYMGYFDVPAKDENNQLTSTVAPVYFYLSDDLDMTGYVLPPIGTTDHPFIGNFDGNGHTVSNLTVSNDINQVTNIPRLVQEETSTSGGKLSGVNIVGLFGVVGEYGDFLTVQGLTFDSSTTAVKDLRVTNLTVKTETAQSLAGIVAGYVQERNSDPGDGLCPLSGVIVTGQNTIQSTAANPQAITALSANLSDYTLVGACSENCRATIYKNIVDVSITNEAGKWQTSQLPGASWGSSIDMYGVYGRLRYARSEASNLTYHNTTVVTYKALGDSTSRAISESGTTASKNTNYFGYFPTTPGAGNYISHRYQANTGYRYMELPGVTGTVGTESVRYYSDEEFNSRATAKPRPYMEAFIGNSSDYTSSPVNDTMTDYVEVSYDGANVVILSSTLDGVTHYLAIDNSGAAPVLKDTLDRSEAARWRREGDTLSIQYAQGYTTPDQNTTDEDRLAYAQNQTRYFLYGSSGTLSLGAASSAWEFGTDTVSCGLFYLHFDGSSWALSANGFMISDADGNNYLSINQNGTFSNASGSGTVWRMDANSHIYATVNGQTWYLRNNNNELASTQTAGSAAAWTTDENGKLYTGDGLYLTYDGNSFASTAHWGLTYGVFTDGNGHYLARGTASANGNNPTYYGVANTNNRSNALTFFREGNYLYTTINGTKYYLYRYDATTLRLYSNNNRSNWTVDTVNHRISTTYNNTTYYVYYNNTTWSLTTNGEDGFRIRFDGDKYLRFTGTDNSAASYTTNQNDATIWFVDEDDRIFTSANGNNYYLVYNNNRPLGCSTSTTNAYTRYNYNPATGSMKLRYSTTGWFANTYYAQYTGGNWNRNNNESNGTTLYLESVPGTSLVSVLIGAGTAELHISSSGSSYTAADASSASDTLVWLEKSTDTPLHKNEYVNYFPLVVKDQATQKVNFSTSSWTVNAGSTINLDPDDLNSGYIIGGNQYLDTEGLEGDIRVSFFDMSNMSVALGNNVTTYTATTNLQVLACKSDGTYARVNDSHNSNTGVNNSISGLSYQTSAQLGLQKYDAARENLNTMFLKDPSHLYGLHFMNADIGMDNLVTADSVSIYGTVYENYQLPADSINFSLPQRGYINFFAGTYFTNNNTFFSLHEIQRAGKTDGTIQTITSIKEIAKIYKRSGQADYVYAYVGEAFTPQSGDTLVFDMDWVKNPKTWVDKALYYYEIPVNAGEYALGSVSGKIGAYLVYLDLSLGSKTGQRTKITEQVDTTRTTYEYPLGVTYAVQSAIADTELQCAAAFAFAPATGTITTSSSADSDAVSYSGTLSGATVCLHDGITVTDSGSKLTETTNGSETLSNYTSVIQDYDLSEETPRLRWTLTTSTASEESETWTAVQDASETDEMPATADLLSSQLGWKTKEGEYQQLTFAYSYSIVTNNAPVHTISSTFTDYNSDTELGLCTLDETVTTPNEVTAKVTEPVTVVKATLTDLTPLTGSDTLEVAYTLDGSATDGDGSTIKNIAQDGALKIPVHAQRRLMMSTGRKTAAVGPARTSFTPPKTVFEPTPVQFHNHAGDEYEIEYHFISTYVEPDTAISISSDAISHVHDWIPGKTISEPTCTSAGERWYTCSTCGYETKGLIFAPGHNWGEPTLMVSEDYSKADLWYLCIRCGESRIVALDAAAEEASLLSFEDEEFVEILCSDDNIDCLLFVLRNADGFAKHLAARINVIADDDLRAQAQTYAAQLISVFDPNHEHAWSAGVIDHMTGELVSTCTLCGEVKRQLIERETYWDEAAALSEGEHLGVTADVRTHLTLHGLPTALTLADASALAGWSWDDNAPEDLPAGLLALRIPATAEGTLTLRTSGPSPVFLLADGTELAPAADAETGEITIDRAFLSRAAYLTLDPADYLLLLAAPAPDAEADPADVEATVLAGLTLRYAAIEAAELIVHDDASTPDDDVVLTSMEVDDGAVVGFYRSASAYSVCTSHIWDDGVVTKEPSADEYGEKTHTCSICGAVRIGKLDPATGYEIDDDTGYLIDPDTGYLIDPDTGMLIDPQTRRLLDRLTGYIYDPETGWLFDPAHGKFYDRETGYEINPANGWLIDPMTGYEINPDTGDLTDPRTGYIYDTRTGRFTDPETGKLYDPATGYEIDRVSGNLIDPDTGDLLDPRTLEPIRPSDPDDPYSIGDDVEPVKVDPDDPYHVGSDTDPAKIDDPYSVDADTDPKRKVNP